MNNNIHVVWEPDVNEEPIVLNYILERIKEKQFLDNFSYCEEKNISLVNIKQSDIIDTLQNMSSVELFSTKQHNYYMLYEDSIFSKIVFSNRTNYISIHFTVYGQTVSKVNSFLNDMIELLCNFIEAKNTLNISWYTSNPHGSCSYDVVEVYDDIIYKEAYPYIENFNDHINSFIESDEQVLILLGPPGTGKSRLIRYILYLISSRSETNQKDNLILYTNDQNTLEQDDIYMDFMTRGCVALVAEDIDNHLKDRNGGSNAIYRILNAADGLIRGHGQKILLSTNIPSAKDIDEALIRPGRCFDVITTRKLNAEEASTLLEKITNEDVDELKTSIKPNEKYTTAEVYNLVRKKKYSCKK